MGLLVVMTVMMMMKIDCLIAVALGVLVMRGKDQKG